MCADCINHFGRAHARFDTYLVHTLRSVIVIDWTIGKLGLIDCRVILRDWFGSLGENVTF